MKKYGLQLRAPPSQQKKQPARPPLPPPAGFRDDDGDDDGVESEIARQSAKNRALREIEEQHRKALEEDPSVFDYDGVYDDMKAKVAQPRALDREERKPKYIEKLLKKAEQRQREQEIVYERKLAKERSTEDHLYADKDKFVTSAYKKKLAEQAKWMEEERLRQIREEKDDVTKKKDLTDFYFNLEKNVAFGASALESRKMEKHAELKKPEKHVELQKPEKHEEKMNVNISGEGPSSITKNSHTEPSRTPEGLQAEASPDSKKSFEAIRETQVADASAEEKPEPSSSDQPPPVHHKRSQDALAAAKERFLARKKAKEQ
ncbi:uncharacterized protein LOC115674645 [Syzygium oleosum]|uniref:uncharacterized protein LOC115674645 n=1 Tax=Syzygium oleosum TaxID=219896 RepID=UPI0011D25BDB|nr:uncharacterized protein LOC115674645 [Syzygium oleosum]